MTMQPLSLNTKAILLLTAPLISGSRTPGPRLLTHSEYNRLAYHLHERHREPGDFLAPDATQLIESCRNIVDKARLQALLQRGMLLAQVVEQWRKLAIWVLSRADETYPRSLKSRLKSAAPPLLYGCGDRQLLENGGLAVVGSRRADDGLLDYTLAVGALAAAADSTIVSGGARGIDQAAMKGALNAGGRVVGMLADSLYKWAIHREYRKALLEGRLVLVSPHDPRAGFNVGNAMQRNKLIYASADAALVVSSDYNKGGTWAGAIEQIEQYRFVPVFVRSKGTSSNGLEALKKKGARSWPEPESIESFNAALHAPLSSGTEAPSDALMLFPEQESENIFPETASEKPVQADDAELSAIPLSRNCDTEQADGQQQSEKSPAETIFMAVRDALSVLLDKPMNDREIAQKLDVSVVQARTWVTRLVDEGVIIKQSKPVRYIRRDSSAFPGI